LVWLVYILPTASDNLPCIRLRAYGKGQIHWVGLARRLAAQFGKRQGKREPPVMKKRWLLRGQGTIRNAFSE